jgi:hypothetical protein
MASFSAAPAAPEMVAVDRSSVHGLGVKAAAHIQTDQLLFQEPPLLRLQSLTNRNDALVCACCFRFVGSLSNQVDMLRRRLNRLSEFDVRPKFAGDRQLSAVVKCGFMCGEIYCSEHCRSTHWNRSHSLLCTGCVSEVRTSHKLSLSPNVVSGGSFVASIAGVQTVCDRHQRDISFSWRSICYVGAASKIDVFD